MLKGRELLSGGVLQVQIEVWVECRGKRGLDTIRVSTPRALPVRGARELVPRVLPGLPGVGAAPQCTQHTGRARG